MSNDRQQRTSAPSPGRLLVGLVTAAVVLVVVVVTQVIGIDRRDEPAAPPEPIVVDDVAERLVAIPGGYAIGSFQVYFTEPINTRDESLMVGSPVEQALIDFIGGAQRTLDAAMFEFNAPAVMDALIDAYERGVLVRVVTDGEAGLEDPESLITDLELAGIAVVSDQLRRGLMHNKFFVVDDEWVWTGSTNITRNGFYNNNNNAIVIRSPELAANFSLEFEELFAGQFGKTSDSALAHPVITVDDAVVETFFESEADSAARMAHLLQGATSIRFMAFSFTSGLTWASDSGPRSLMDLIVEEVGAGAEVAGIVEASSRRFVQPLYCGGVDVRQDGNPNVFHHKVIIIDDAIIITGSFNFSQSAANDNDENLLIIHSPAVARAYLEEFQRRWAEANPIPASAFVC